MNVFFHDLKINIKSTLIWIILTVILIIVSMLKGDGFIGNSEANALIQSFPDGIIALFGMSELDLSTFSGYYGVVYVYLIITFCTFSIISINNVFSLEAIEHIAEYLYSKPISKRVIAYNKIASAFIINLIYQLCVLFLVLLYFKLLGTLDNSTTIINMHLHAYIISLLFFGFTLIVIMLKKSLSNAMMISFCGLLITYLLATIDQLLALEQWFSYLTPFIFFSAPNIIDFNFNIAYYIICFIPLIIGLILTYFKMETKDF